jgi:hypothetical protein
MRVVWVQERERERRNCSLPPDYDTDVPGMPDLIPTNKNKGSQEQQAAVAVGDSDRLLFIEFCRTDGSADPAAKLKMKLMKLRRTYG